LEEPIDIGPEGFPGLSIGFGQGVQGLGFAQALQVGILLPPLKGPDDQGPGLARIGGEDFGPGVSLGLQPAEGLDAETIPGGFIGRRIVFRLAGGL
jgi:hypothetical protein